MAKKFDELVKKNQAPKGNDINTYSLSDVREVELKQSRSEKKKQYKTEGAEKVFENEKCVVMRVDTYEASCLYGGGKFCISYKNNREHWDNYTQQEKKTFYYVIDKKDNKPMVIQVDPEYNENEV